MPGEGQILIGTSGWHYRHWVGPFYPPGTATNDFLPYYCQIFRTVEINYSFYRLPEIKTFEQWRDTVPEEFIFSVKASRYITHLKRLIDPSQSLRRFMERVTGLGNKLGPILFQLPPNMGLDTERLEGFLAALPSGCRYAFEFRNQSWFTDEVYVMLGQFNAAFCIFELAGLQSPLVATADFVYVRLHGPEDTKYSGSYDSSVLGEWAERALTWAGDGTDTYIYFDNDQLGYAAQNARELQRLVKTKAR